MEMCFQSVTKMNTLQELVKYVLKKVSLIDTAPLNHYQFHFVEEMLDRIEFLIQNNRFLNIQELITHLYIVIQILVLFN